jgi:hypothetical protein
MLHNRYWDPSTRYSTKNGGQYNFIDDGSKVVVPDDPKFWPDLIANKTRSGLFCYEQDWLDAEMDESRTLGESATAAGTWMRQMNDGCAQFNVTIQLCMSHVRHILQSVEMVAATQARASGDYIHPGPGGGHQWDIGTTSILLHAVGLAPSKDSFWSRQEQQDSSYGRYGYEPHSRLQSAVLSFSAGPVAVSDGVGSSDVGLILRSCDGNGRLLSPDKPATLSDASFTRRAFPTLGQGADGQLWLTYSLVGGARYSYVLAPELHENYAITLGELGYDDARTELVAIRLSDVSLNSSDSRWTQAPPLIPVTADRPLDVRSCDNRDFELILVAPRLPGGWFLLGELSKVRRPLRPFLAAVLTEIYLCNVCSCQKC